uniref:Myosin motor domain-containing protein n=1 Tax=Aureoumbra lagunensis TaxID=44058 RepID=A0A7S3NJJ8_9STRA
MATAHGGWSIGSRVVVEDEEHGYIMGTIEECKGIGQDAELKVKIRNLSKKIIGRAAILVEKGLNMAKVNDLATLDALTEGVMLECLRARYEKDVIYTSIGGVLLATNPFREIDGLYGEHEMEGALGGNLSGQHPFAVAEAAARGLCLDSTSQSVLVSGESGAGKTETVKKVLQYLSFRSRREGTIAENKVLGIDDLVVRTNPILEAFCNAKTCRNENSSRFGKYIKVAMDPLRATVVAATIASYLLEKVRVVHQLRGERNFHIFYQMIRAGALSKKISNNIESYPNLMHGATSTIGGIDDAQVWQQDTAPALNALGLGTDLVPSVIEAVLVVANLEMIALQVAGEDDASILKDKANAAARLGVDALALELALTTRPVATVRAKNSVDAACRARDALAKSIYDKLVLRLIEAMNQVLGGETNFPFVGLLDIFGFESLLINSLEQILINLANERLQQHFNKIVFADEAKEYQREGVPVTATSFIDNAPVIAAIETCVLRPLEDESQLKSGSDDGLVAKFLKKQNDILFKPLRGSSSLFGIQHFAGQVIYETQGLVTKNRDAVPEALISLMANSHINGLRELFFAQQQAADGIGARRGRANAGRRLGLARAFTLSLSALANTLEATTPHFIRCIKTNEQSKPHVFQGAYVLTQLRYMGVLQIIEARKRGYARRLLHAAFKKRYYQAIVNGQFFALDDDDNNSTRRQVYDSDDDDVFTRANKNELSANEMIRAVLNLMPQLTHGEEIALGTTKVFLKLSAYDALEKKRDTALRSAALEALAQANSIDELEAALRIAASDLRIRGPQVDKARSRLADLKFLQAENQALVALDADPRLNVNQLQERLDIAETAITNLDTTGSKDKESRKSALYKRADTLRSRVAALAACARTAEQSIHRFSLEQLECHAEALAACLDDLGHGLNEAPEAIKASNALQACNKAIIDLRGLSEDEDDEVKTEIKDGVPLGVPPKQRQTQEREDEALARRLQAEMDLEARGGTPMPQTARHVHKKKESIQQQEQEEDTKPQPLLWLDDRERAAAEEHGECADGVIAAMNGGDARYSRLTTGICVVKFKISIKTGACSGAWKLLRVQSGKLTWTPLEVAEPGKSSSKKVFRRVVSKVRSDGATGVPVKEIINVSLGPEQPRPAHSFVSAAHFVGSQQHGVPSRWAYITVSTRDRDYLFGFPKPAEDSIGSGGVIDPMMTEPLTWAACLERMADEARGAARALGEGCLARAQRIYLSELALVQEQDGAGSAPLARLCPVLRPLAHVMTQTLEAHPKTRLILGACFGSRAPERLVKASWLAPAVLDAPLSRDFAAFILSKKKAIPPFRAGQLLVEPLKRANDVRLSNVIQVNHHPVLEAVAAYAETNGLGHIVTVPTPSRRRPQTAAGRQASRTLRTAATRELPTRPNLVHLFAACAKLDADLVEALVLRARIRVNDRYDGIDSNTWRRIAGEELAFMEPQRFMTPLSYVVTWCDVLGDRTDGLVRRLLLLRADATMDDGHVEVRFTPLASAVANGSLPLARSLLHIGTDPDIQTSDGRTSLHLLNLAPESHRRSLLELLINAGASIDAKIQSTGDTPLHVAAKEGLIDVVSTLIEFQANTLLTNLAGLTPSEAAFLELSLLDEDDTWTISITDEKASSDVKQNIESIKAKKEAIAQCAHFLA